VRVCQDSCETSAYTGSGQRTWRRAPRRLERRHRAPGLPTGTKAESGAGTPATRIGRISHLCTGFTYRPSRTACGENLSHKAIRPPADDSRQSDADSTPEASDFSEASSESDPEDIPPPTFDAETVQQGDVRPPPSAIYQPDIRTNEIRLPGSQFKNYKVDLALYAYTVQHDLTQASITDLLKLSSTIAKYRTPYRMERFIDASVNFETYTVDCCLIVCLASTHMRAQQTACDSCGVQRYKSNGKPAKHVTYWSLTPWLDHLLGDPDIRKYMLENMAAVRKASDEGVDGTHDYYHATNYHHYRNRGLLDDGPLEMLHSSTDGFQFFRQNGFEG